MSYPIDLVITWVDGNDPEWLAEKKKYEDSSHTISAAPDANDNCRYRENGLLKFLFRGIEEFAPWVNRIFFVTCGQNPEWLNLDHPKLRFVTHKDYIPSEYLPTFNSNTIEMNVHRIDDLSEHFVIFNDDMFLLRPIEEELYFKNGYPVLDTLFAYPPKSIEHNWEHLLYNNYRIVNRTFNPVKSVWKNKGKWFFFPTLGARRVLGNLERFLTHWTLPSGVYGHVALPHLKSSLIEIWDKYPDLMSKSASNKFRTDDQVNQWLICAWDQAKGTFYPAHRKQLGQNLIYADRNLQLALDYIQNPPFPLLCLNETENDIVSDSSKASIIKAFETILPKKSSFEL